MPIVTLFVCQLFWRRLSSCHLLLRLQLSVLLSGSVLKCLLTISQGRVPVGDDFVHALLRQICGTLAALDTDGASASELVIFPQLLDRLNSVSLAFDTSTQSHLVRTTVHRLSPEQANAYFQTVSLLCLFRGTYTKNTKEKTYGYTFSGFASSFPFFKFPVNNVITYTLFSSHFFGALRATAYIRAGAT